MSDVNPNYPFVVVERLPKTIETASGILIGDDTNKPIHEGVVIATWKPWVKFLGESTGDDGLVLKKTLRMESQVKPGDFVLFPHGAGYTHNPRNEKESFVAEKNILGVVGGDTENFDALAQLLERIIENTPGGTAELLSTLADEYIVVKKRAVTTSGACVNDLY